MKANREWLKWAGLTGWSALLILVVYGSALNLPYMADDYFHLPYVDTHSVGQMWQTAEGLYYFRPLSFTIWKLMEPVFGYHNLFAQHTLNLLLHLGNALMVAWLAGHLWSASGRGDWRRRVLSATLFALYPFSYEAVPWIGSLVHPLVTFLILASVISYLRLRASGKWRWGLISLAIAVLSPFAHENGVLVAPLIGLIELTDPKPIESAWRRARRVTIWLVPTLIWFVIWRGVPSDRGTVHLAMNSIVNILRDGLYFAQGSGYPVTWLGGWLRDTLSLNDFVVALALSAIAAALAAVVQWRGGANRRGWLPWLWIGAASLPVVLFLDYWYVSAAPRMLMLASVGGAWLWTDVIVRLIDWPHATAMRRRVSSAAAIGLGAILCVSSYNFIHDQMRIYDLGGGATRRMIDATRTANDAGQTAIFVNLPVWIAAQHTTYPIGQEGVVFLSFFDRLTTAVQIHTGRLAQVEAFRFDAIRSDVPYYAGVLGAGPAWDRLARTGGQVFVTHYMTAEVAIDPVGVLSEPAPLTPPIARFGQSVSLFDASAVNQPNGVQVNVVWQVNEPAADDVTVFVHVLDVNGQLMAQADGDPLGGSYPFGQWPTGLIVRDIRSIQAARAGASVQIGLYRQSSGERLIARSSDGAPLADNAVSIAVQSGP